ncbi:unnamed protein product [Amoebophrya sp. A25]|nr:unnamed protein product [Amoebophrya sp. A25]|eukprot:GSA25T00015889001.1
MTSTQGLSLGGTVDVGLQAATICPATVEVRTLTMSMLRKRVNSVKRGKDESVKSWMKKITHLHLEELDITRWGQTFGANVPNLKVLYCYDNALSQVDPLPLKVELLYLQNNALPEFAFENIFMTREQLSRLQLAATEQKSSTESEDQSAAEGCSVAAAASGGDERVEQELVEAAKACGAEEGRRGSKSAAAEQHACSLRSLNLSGNKLESLDFSSEKFADSSVRLPSLSWLAMSSNPYLETLYLSGVASTLEFLDVRGCKLTTLQPTACLVNLKILHCENNELESLQDAVESLPTQQLTLFTVHPNPFTKSEKKYQEPLILTAPRLEKIDQRDITDTERTFLQELWRRRHERASNESATAAAES